MKKILLFMVMLFSMCGCSCKDKPVCVTLKYEQMPTAAQSSEYLMEKGNLLTYDLKSIGDYDVKIENKDSFFLLIYRNGCEGCRIVSPILKEYVDETNAVIYSLELDTVPYSHSLYKKDGLNAETPLFVLIKEGNVVYKETAKLINSKEEDKKWVNDWFKTHVKWEE